MKGPVLIVGASGFIGRNLVDALFRKQYAIVATYASKNNIDPRKAVPFHLDLSNRNRCRELLAKYRFVAIYYLASATDVSGSIASPAADSRNILHLLTFLEELERSGSLAASKFIYASSGGTLYGNAGDRPASEDAPLSPLSPYGISRAAMEAYLRYFRVNGGLHYVALRYANPYGCYQDPCSGTGAPTIFLYKVLTGEPIVIYGDPAEIRRDYIYISDAIDITVRIAEAENPRSLYNIGCGHSSSLLQLIRLIEKTTNRKAILHLREPRQSLVQKVDLDVRHVKRDYAWEPKVPLPEGIEKNYAWLKEWLQDRAHAWKKEGFS